MARKIVDRKALREEVEAAESAEAADKKPKAATRKTAKKPKAATRKTAKRKSRAKEPTPARLKLYWGVFSQSMKRVALYEHHQKKAAEQKARALSQSSKTPHFVQRVKEAIE